MHILVVNCGSSSLKSDIIDAKSGAHVVTARVERIGESEPLCTIDGGEPMPCAAGDHREALSDLLPRLMEQLPDGAAIEGVGHRVVHGGERFKHPTVIDDDVVDAIEEMVPLAPLHNPNNLAGIRAARELLSDVPHVAVFDTAFHSTLPGRARRYAIPEELVEKHQLRRFGFHGISHAYVARQAASYLDDDIRNLRIITCHLGNGCSVCAVEYGRSVETSMGMTPLEGLVMGTRSGDLDPGIILQLMRAEGLSVDEVDELLNRHSGLAGLSGVGNDMRDIEQRAADGDENSRHAIQVFAHRLRKYIGAYAAAMGGVDAIVFTAGIGENSSVVRHRVAQRLDFLGARLDEDANREAKATSEAPVVEISTRHSRTRLLVVKTDEQRSIAEETAKLVRHQQDTTGTRTIPVAISARHVHLTQEMVERLFGEGYELTERNPLSQPGQFAANETVTIVGPKRTLENVRILGPTRSRNQVEISRTDEFFLGIDAPVRASGDVKNTPGCTLIGPAGEATLEDGVICAWRHIHMTPEDAEHFGVQDKDVVEVAIQSAGRDLIFGDVLVRVSPKYKLEMHIDTDEGNAADLPRHSEAMLVSTDSTASLTRRATRYD
jgi:acetate kinase